MTKLRKQRKRKSYRFNVNRKRLRNKMYGTGKIACKEVDKQWNEKHSVRSNLQSMGLSHDPNETLRIPKRYAELKSGWQVEKIPDDRPKPLKVHVAEELELEAKAPRVRQLRLPKSQVHWLSYLLDTYGRDYKSMARDSKNHYQETWKQLRAKIKQFKSIPEQYSEYLRERNLDANDDGEDSGLSSD